MNTPVYDALEAYKLKWFPDPRGVCKELLRSSKEQDSSEEAGGGAGPKDAENNIKSSR